MSFHDYSSFIFGFDALDNRMPNENEQLRYYNKWMKNYASLFKLREDFAGIEWDLRCRKALREIFSSATFFVEAQKNLEMKCFSSYYFCFYYSLFHAIYSVLFLDSKLNANKLINITHKNIINLFYSNFCTGSNIMSKDIKNLFEYLKYMREYYSYVTPFNNIFSENEYIIQLDNVLKGCYQLSSFHSLLVEKSYNKNFGKVIRINDQGLFQDFNSLFETLFSKQYSSDSRLLEPACKILREELINWGFKPFYFMLDLEHQFDEFHTYDNYEDNENQYSLKITDIWSYIYSSLTN